MDRVGLAVCPIAETTNPQRMGAAPKQNAEAMDAFKKTSPNVW
jgi:hypothetical protein